MLKIDYRTFKLAEDLDLYLSESEQSKPSIIPGVEKQIIWHGNSNEKTELALVYLHGFSATHKDLAPVIEQAAKKLKANIFLGRLTAHGMQSDDFSAVSASDWINDAEEAYQIGQRIGKKVIVVGMSTGATLATYLTYRYPDIYASVLLSANFFPKNHSGRFLIRPWGELLTRIVVGKKRIWEPESKEHSLYWNHSYSSKSFVQVTLLVDYVYKFDLLKIKSPVLAVYYANDDAVDVDMMRFRFEQFGSTKKSIRKLKTADRHELAGDILNPSGNAELKEYIVSFIREIV